VLFVVFAAVSLLSILYPYTRSEHALAATNSTLNFQARILTSAGAVIPDGSYNVKFRIYDGGTSGGPSGAGAANSGTGGVPLWTETWQNSASNGIVVKNGYITASLGSITSFPGTMPWDQELWITMDIGGTGTGGSPTYDGEMRSEGSKRIKITAVPYAFRAAEATMLKTVNGANVSTLSLNTTSSTQSFQITDQGSAGTYTVAILNGAAQTFTNLNTFSAAGTGLAVTNNATVGGTLAVTGLTTATGGLTTGANSTLTVGGATVNNTYAIGNLNYSGSGNTGSIGSAASTVDIYTNFTIAQTTAGQTLTIPAPTTTTSGRIIYVTNIGSAGYTMAGAIVSPGVTMQFVWNNTTSSWSLVTSGVSGSYIQNGTSTQTGNFNIQSNSTSAVTATIQGANSQSANVLEVKAAGVTDPLFAVSATGAVTFQNSTDSTTGFRVLDADGGTPILNIDTTNEFVGIGTGSPANKLSVNSLTTADSLAQVAISTGGTTSKGLVIQGVASQAANLFEIQNSNGDPVLYATNSGLLVTTSDVVSTIGTFRTSESAAANTISNTFRSGNVVSGSYNSGDVTIKSGNAISGATGNVIIDAGSTAGTAGQINIGSTNASAVNVGRSGATLALQGNSSTSLAVGSGGNVTTLNFAAPSGTNTITFPAASGTVQLAPTTGSYIKQVPGSTAENTITPTANGVVGLSVNGTSGTAAVALDVLQTGAQTALVVTSNNTGNGQNINLTNTTGTQVNGLLINRNGAGGTTTNLLNLSNTAGTVTNGINLTGTFTNLINSANFSVTNAGAVTAVGVNAGVGLLQGSLGLTVSGAAASINDNSNFNTTINTGSSTGSVTIGSANAGAISLQSSTGISLGGAAAATYTIGTSNNTGGITVGNSTATNTISIGSAAGNGNTQTINIGTSATAGSTTNIVVGSTIAGTSTIQSASTINLNAPTIVGNATTQALFNTGATTVNAFGAATAINLGASTGTLTVNNATLQAKDITTSNTTANLFNTTATTVNAFGASTNTTLGATTGTLTVRNANTTLGNAAGSGVLTNNGATVNTAYNVGNLATGGWDAGGAAATVDKYTYITIAQTTAGQTVTVPTPTANTTYGRVIYLSNIGTASFTLGGTTVSAGTTATLVWSNTNGTPSWQFAGADGNGILNQNSSDQTANFRISGTGRANTSFISPLFDSISGGLSIGTSTATGVTIGGTTNTTSISLQGAAAATYTIGTSNNTGGITVGNSTATNTISIGSAAGAGNTQTINIGASATATSNTAITLGSLTGTSTTNIQAGTGTAAGDLNLFTAAGGIINIGGNAVNNKVLNLGSTGTTNAASTINIATTNANQTQSVTIGNTTSANNAVLIQGGTSATAIRLSAGAGGTISLGATNNNIVNINTAAVAGTTTIGGTGTTGTITLGQSTATNTIAIGNANTATGNTQTINIGAGTPAGTGNTLITLGNNVNNSAVTLVAGTGNINLNSGTIATNATTLNLFNTNAATVNLLQAATSVSLGATTGTLTVRNANQTFGNAAGSGTFTNNGGTVNTTLAVANDTNGGPLGNGLTAAASVDVYTSISVNQTTAGQTITLPTPSASTTYGRVLYLSNIGTTSFTLGGVTINPGTTATLIWSNTNGGASWQFAGADGNGILNQNSSDQTANFRITGTGRANTSFTSPLFDSITGGLSVGTSTATSVTVGGTTNTMAIALQGATAATYTIGTTTGTGTITVGQSTATNTINIGSAAGNAATQTINIGASATAGSTTNLTVGSLVGSSATTIQGGTGNIKLQTNSASAGVIAKTQTNSATAFQVQDSSNNGIFTVRTTDQVVKISTTYSAPTTNNDASLEVDTNMTSTSGYPVAIGVSASVAPTSASSINYWGGYFDVHGSGANLAGATLYGIHTTASNSDTGDISSVIGVDGSADNNDVGTITNAYAGNFRVWNGGGGTITNGFGVNANVTNDDGIMSGATAINAGVQAAGTATISNAFGLVTRTQNFSSNSINQVFGLYLGESQGTVGVEYGLSVEYMNNAGTSYPIYLNGASNAILSVNGEGQTNFRNNSDSNTAFRIQSNGGDTLFTADTSNNRIKIGNDTGTGTNTTVLVLDSASTSTGLAAVNGSMYYDTTAGRIQCYESGAWGNCGNTTLQEAYTSSTGGTTPEVLLDNTRNGLDIQDANTTLGNSVALLAVRASATATTLGASLFQVNNNAGVPLVGIGLGTQTASTGIDMQFGGSANRTIQVLQNTTTGAGRSLTVQAGQGNSGAGGVLNLNGGAANGTNQNGGNINITGGASTGTGAQGLVNLSSTTFVSSGSTQNFAANGSVSGIDSYSTIVASATAAGLTITVPTPTFQTVGRVVYVSAANGSNDFALSLAGTSVEIAMKANSTATLIWNGTGWTAAGASSSTTLQAAYDNTLVSAGGAEILLNSSTAGGDGLTIRNNTGVKTITGALLEVQTNVGSNLFSVNNNSTEYANNGGAETQGASSSTFPAGTWTTSPTGGATATISRDTTVFATGIASAKVVTTGATTANQGIANTLTTTLTANLQYTVSFTVKGTTSFNTLDVYYSKDGTNTSPVSCSTGNTVTASGWTRVGCTFTAPASGITSSNAIFIRQSNSNSSARTYYIDNLSVAVNASVNHAIDGSVDSAPGTNWVAIGGSVTRDTSTLYDTGGSLAATTSGVAGRGVYNNLTAGIVPAVSTQYRVSFYANANSSTATLAIAYTPDNNATSVSCQDYNTQVVTAGTWTLITCFFTTSATTPVTSQQLRITQTAGSATIFYVDSLNVTLNNNNASNVQIGGGNKGGPTTLLTLDRSSTAPIAANNDAYLGSMYYDTTTGRIQCYEADGWGACGSAPDNIVNLNPEYAGAVLNGTGVGTMTTDFCSNQLGVLQINYTLCDGTGTPAVKAANYYRWTSPQATQQTYSIYVTYQLPTTFKSFASDATVQLTGRVDSTSNAAVTYEMFRSEGGTVYACGSETAVTSTANTWQTVGINGNEATGCGFTSSSGGAYVIFKINVKANSGANAYVGTLSFTTTGK